MTARDMARFCSFSPPAIRAIISRFWGDFLTNLHRKKKGEKEKNPLEKIQELQWRNFFRNCRFLSLAMVRCVLTFRDILGLLMLAGADLIMWWMLPAPVSLDVLLQGQLFTPPPHPWKYTPRGRGCLKEGGGCKFLGLWGGGSKGGEGIQNLLPSPPSPLKLAWGPKRERGGGVGRT